jgi:hypothetical protein
VAVSAAESMADGWRLTWPGAPASDVHLPFRVRAIAAACHWVLQVGRRIGRWVAVNVDGRSATPALTGDDGTVGNRAGILSRAKCHAV